MSDPTALAGVLESIPRARVLVVGDVMLDRFVAGTVERISPEAPIPIVRIQSENNMVGGAGNVARNVVALGAGAALVGLCGDDATGGALRAQFAALNGLEAHLVVERGRVTTEKTRFFGGSQQLLRADREVSGAPAADAAKGLLAAVDAGAKDVGAIVVSDYAKGVISAPVVARALEHAKRRKVPVLVDPKGKDFRRYAGAAVLTPNAGELAAASGMPVGSDDTVVAAANAVIEQAGVGAIVATRGAAGMSVIEKGRPSVHLKVRAREVFDVSGAGDTVVATLAAALATGASLVQAAELANVAAGIVVGKIGTAVASQAEVLEALYARDLLAADDKVVDLTAALERVKRWRRNGETVAFTNGCFDLVHPGHVSLLNQARAAAGRLIVGLNTDASVRRLKGESRPILDEAARATVLASFAAVDLVVPFDDDTPLRLIEALRPDVLVKGADYTIAQVVGADVVRSYGGRVLLATLVPGASSTSIVSRIGAKQNRS
jgi:D-beta-D-heptose 7-phosphate kinase/D-beta-D-heptose 1-phosphate adenosyltransferase